MLYFNKQEDVRCQDEGEKKKGNEKKGRNFPSFGAEKKIPQQQHLAANLEETNFLLRV